jgi:NTP pyrophosphatase (non-canonical NTP hydrolase)
MSEKLINITLTLEEAYEVFESLRYSNHHDSLAGDATGDLAERFEKLIVRAEQKLPLTP